MVSRVAKELMPTFPIKIYNLKVFKNCQNQQLQQKGFTLFEILAVLTLIGIMTAVGLRLLNRQNARDYLEDTRAQLERSIRFAGNESVIQNKLTRLKFNLGTVNSQEDTSKALAPQTYTTEVSSHEDMLIPEPLDEHADFQEKKELAKMQTSFDQGFTTLESADQKEFVSDVRLIAIGAAEKKDLITQGIFYLYIHPSGEKDSVLFFFEAEQELLVVEVEAFRERLPTSFYPLIESGVEINSLKKAKEVFEQWKKK